MDKQIGSMGRSVRRRASGFTLVELLTVIAIIGLLIGLLIPGLSKARDAAKTVKTRAVMKGIGDGLEMFKNENEAEMRAGNYPPSAAGDDPTDAEDHSANGDEEMFGAQWLVRYLMGKKLDGYVAQRSVPRGCWGQNVYDQQVGWYGAPGEGDTENPWPGPNWTETPTEPFARSGPYLPPEGYRVKAPKDLYKEPPLAPSDLDKIMYKNPVILDAFEMPIVYYASNSAQASKGNANIATYEGPIGNQYAAVFTFRDNWIFTGLCKGGTCDRPPWNFGGGDQKMKFGPDGWVTQDESGAKLMRQQIGQYNSSFPYIIMNRDAYDATNGKSVVPYRKDSFILMSPGKDGVFGTGDDVRNY